MSKPEAIQEEIIKAIKKIPIDRLGEALELIKAMSRKPVELTPKEIEEIKKIEKEMDEGKFITLEELERDL